MSERWLVTMLAECDLRVAACALTENQADSTKSFRCVRGLAWNAQQGRRWGERE